MRAAKDSIVKQMGEGLYNYKMKLESKVRQDSIKNNNLIVEQQLRNKKSTKEKVE